LVPHRPFQTAPALEDFHVSITDWAREAGSTDKPGEVSHVMLKFEGPKQVVKLYACFYRPSPTHGKVELVALVDLAAAPPASSKQKKNGGKEEAEKEKPAPPYFHMNAEVLAKTPNPFSEVAISAPFFLTSRSD
jgi:hypothetical protein